MRALERQEGMDLSILDAAEAHHSHDIMHALAQLGMRQARPVPQDSLELQCLPGIQRGHEQLLLRHIGAALLEVLRQRRAIHPHL